MQGPIKLQEAIKTVFVVLILLVAIVVVPLITSVSAQPKGNEGKGRYYFRQTCKNCHTKGAPGGEVTPLSKTQAQWKSYFTTGKHAKRTEPLAKVMSDDQLRDVETFLVNHAADSLQPETCGK